MRAFGVQPREHVVRGCFQPWPKALFGELFGGRQRSAGGVEFAERLVGGLGFHLPFAKTLQRVLRFRQRGFVRTRGFDTAAAHGANRFRGTGDATAAIELGDPRLRAGDLALHAGDFRSKQRSRGHRRVAVGFEIGDRLRCFAGEIFPAAIERGGGADFEIGDAGVGGVETAALLLVACDRQRQRALGTLHGRGRIAHLLVENEQRRAVFQFFPRCSHAAPEKRQNSFEHW